MAAVERRLWLACAPPLTRVPEVGSICYYFPSGHAHQCDGGAAATGEIAAEKVLCVVGEVALLAAGDDVYSRIRLTPIPKQPEQEQPPIGDGQGTRSRDALVRRDAAPVGDVDTLLHRPVDDDSKHSRVGHAIVDPPVHRLVDHVRAGLDTLVRRDAAPVGDVDALIHRPVDDDVDSKHARHGLPAPVKENGYEISNDYGGGFVHDGLASPVDDDCHNLRAATADASVDHAAIAADALVRLDTARRAPRASVHKAPVQGTEPKLPVDYALEVLVRRDVEDAKLTVDVLVRRDVADTKVIVHDVGDAFFRDAKLHDANPASVHKDASHGLPAPVQGTGHAHGYPELPVDHAIADTVTGQARRDTKDVLLIFPKVLTPSQVIIDDRGTLHISTICALALFPPLPEVVRVNGRPKQSLAMFDLEGQEFSFTQTLCGVPGRRLQHMLTGGWLKYLRKKLPKEDEVLLFLRSGDKLYVVLQRMAAPSAVVGADEVGDAARLADEGATFTVHWCPRRGAEFVVPQEEVEQALGVQWKVGMRVSCRTGVIKPGMVHQELPHQLSFKNGTVRAVHHDRDWNRVLVDWDGEPSTATGTPALRLFGVTICP